jgi:hypothetical protein
MIPTAAHVPHLQSPDIKRLLVYKISLLNLRFRVTLFESCKEGSFYHEHYHGS